MPSPNPSSVVQRRIPAANKVPSPTQQYHSHGSTFSFTQIPASQRFSVASSDICFFCEKKVYLMERQSAEGVFFPPTLFQVAMYARVCVCACVHALVHACVVHVFIPHSHPHSYPYQSPTHPPLTPSPKPLRPHSPSFTPSLTPSPLHSPPHLHPHSPPHLPPHPNPYSPSLTLTHTLTHTFTRISPTPHWRPHSHLHPHPHLIHTFTDVPIVSVSSKWVTTPIRGGRMGNKGSSSADRTSDSSSCRIPKPSTTPEQGWVVPSQLHPPGRKNRWT